MRLCEVSYRTIEPLILFMHGRPGQQRRSQDQQWQDQDQGQDHNSQDQDRDQDRHWQDQDRDQDHC